MAAKEVSYKVYVLTSHNYDLSEETRTIKPKELAPGEVVIKTGAAGVCHSDVHFWHGVYQVGKSKDKVVSFAERGISLPRVPGHEIAGEVYAMGNKAKAQSGLTTGDRVLVFPWVGCDTCKECESGDPSMCSVESRDHGFIQDGGYSEYVKVLSYRHVFKVPDSIPYEMAAILPCSALTAYSAVKKIDPVVEHVHRELKVVPVIGVIGLGGLGQWGLKLLRCVYKDVPIQVIGMDISETKTEHIKKERLAEETFVMDVTTTAKEQADAFSAKFNNQRINCMLDFVNTTETFQFSIAVLQKCGILVCVGLHGGLGEIQLPFLALNSLTITGVYTGTVASMKELLKMVTENSIKSPIITRYPLSEATRALCDLNGGKILGRCILVSGEGV